MASISAKAVKCERQMPLSSGAETAASVKGATIFNRGKKPFIITHFEFGYDALAERLVTKMYLIFINFHNLPSI